MITETELEKIIKKCNTIRDCLESFLKSRVDQYDVNDFLNKDPLAPIIGTICDEKN
jgi:hypothetical protein